MPRTGARDWDPQVMIRLITPERMSTYLDACSGDIDDAFTLYRRNIDIASSIQAITAMVEVVSRNAIDRALTGYVAHTGQVDDWFDLPVLDAKAQDDIRVARQRVRRSGNRVDHPHLVAELSFGFWRFLTTKRYLTTLWMPAIQHAFPHGDKDALKRQQQVAKALHGMTFIRNRAAHLEPVFRRDLAADFRRACLLMEWIDPNPRAWLEENIQMTK